MNRERSEYVGDRRAVGRRREQRIANAPILSAETENGASASLLTTRSVTSLTGMLKRSVGH